MEVGIVILVVALVIAGAIWSSITTRKRREALLEVATRLGLAYSADKDRPLAARFSFLRNLAQGSNRYAYNVISGEYRGHPVTVFDYHYQTQSTGSKGRRRTQHHHLSVFTLELPRDFPELTITREGLFSKIAQSFGYDDIDFESHEFSRKFCVRSRDKKFAYDFCHARAMEYLLANDDLNLEIEGMTLAILCSRCLHPEQIEPQLNRLVELRRLIPGYLLTPA